MCCRHPNTRVQSLALELTLSPGEQQVTASGSEVQKDPEAASWAEGPARGLPGVRGSRELEGRTTGFTVSDHSV